MSPPVVQQRNAIPTPTQSRMSIHELDTSSPTPPFQPSTLSLTDFLNSSVNDDTKNEIVRVGLNENQLIHIQYCQNGDITPYIENFQLGNGIDGNSMDVRHPPSSVEDVNDNLSTEHDDDQTVECDNSEDDEDSTASRIEPTQEELYLRETALIQEENDANQFEFELTNRENVLQISLCARETLLIRREYEVTRRHQFLKLREKFIREHEENDNNNETFPQVEIARED